MAHKCNYRLLTEKRIATKLSFNSSINSFASFSTTGMIAFMSLEVPLRPRVAQSLTEAGCLKNSTSNPIVFADLLIKINLFDWFNPILGIHCVFVTDVSLT